MKKERIIEILILIGLILALITGGLMFRYYKYIKPNSYNIVFKDIDSIVKGSPVRFMGLNIGYVSRLKRKDGYIICRIRVTKKDVKIPPATRAKIAFNGLGGSKSVELFPPDSDNPVIGGIIAAESLRINDLGGLFENLKDVCMMINDFVQHFDESAFMVSVHEVLNPEVINRVDEDMEKMIEMTDKSQEQIKTINEKGDLFGNFIETLNNAVIQAKEALIK